MSIIYHVLLLDGSNFEVTLDVSRTMLLFQNSLLSQVTKCQDA